MPDSHDEIRALAVTLNAMLERLAAAASANGSSSPMSRTSFAAH